jgi:hypothetical protein
MMLLAHIRNCLLVGFALSVAFAIGGCRGGTQPVIVDGALTDGRGLDLGTDLAEVGDAAKDADPNAITAETVITFIETEGVGKIAVR